MISPYSEEKLVEETMKVGGGVSDYEEDEFKVQPKESTLKQKKREGGKRRGKLWRKKRKEYDRKGRKRRRRPHQYKAKEKIRKTGNGRAVKAGGKKSLRNNVELVLDNATKEQNGRCAGGIRHGAQGRKTN